MHKIFEYLFGSRNESEDKTEEKKEPQETSVSVDSSKQEHEQEHEEKTETVDMTSPDFGFFDPREENENEYGFSWCNFIYTEDIPYKTVYLDKNSLKEILRYSILATISHKTLNGETKIYKTRTNVVFFKTKNGNIIMTSKYSSNGYCVHILKNNEFMVLLDVLFGEFRYYKSSEGLGRFKYLTAGMNTIDFIAETLHIGTFENLYVDDVSIDGKISISDRELLIESTVEI